MPKIKNTNTKFITMVSILSSISVILFYVGGIPVLLIFPNLKIDLSDIPALIGGIIISPSAGLLIELIKNSIHLFKTSTMGIGELMGLIVGSTLVISFCIPFHFFTKRNISKIKIYLASYGISLILTIVMAVIANSIIYPLFLSAISKAPISRATMISYLTAVSAMNFIKITITVICGYIVMKFVDTKNNSIIIK